MTDRISGIGSAVASSMMQMWQDYLFKKVDANSDGSIDRDEMEAVSQSQQTGPGVDQIFSSLDSNQDTLISMQEAEAGLSRMGQEMKKEGFPMNMGMTKGQAGRDGGENIFDTIDADGDGYASMEELTTAFGSDAAKIMNLIDTDGDGQISRAESDAHEAEKKAQGSMMSPGISAGNSPMFTDFFNSIDTGRDGSISQEELEAAMGDSAGNIGTVFSQLDANEDGSIDSSELETALQASMPPPPPPPPPGGMAEATGSSSSSGSGQTTETVLSAIDTNGDGYISPEELAAYLEQQENASGTSGSIYSQLSDIQSRLFSTLLGSTIDTIS